MSLALIFFPQVLTLKNYFTCWVLLNQIALSLSWGLSFTAHILMFPYLAHLHLIVFQTSNPDVCFDFFLKTNWSSSSQYQFSEFNFFFGEGAEDILSSGVEILPFLFLSLGFMCPWVMRNCFLANIAKISFIGIFGQGAGGKNTIWGKWPLLI